MIALVIARRQYPWLLALHGREVIGSHCGLLTQVDGLMSMFFVRLNGGLMVVWRVVAASVESWNQGRRNGMIQRVLDETEDEDAFMAIRRNR